MHDEPYTENKNTRFNLVESKAEGTQVIKVSPRYGVSLHRQGLDRGLAEVFYVANVITGLETEEESWRKIEDPNGIIRLVIYSGSMELAQSYAQGAVDAMRILISRRTEAETEEPPLPEEPSDDIVRCPKCMEPMKHITWGPKGPFYGCYSYPNCRGFRTIEDAKKSVMRKK